MIKKTISLFLALVICLLLAACGGEGDSIPDGDAAVPSASGDATQTLSPVDDASDTEMELFVPITAGDVQVVIMGVDYGYFDLEPLTNGEGTDGDEVYINIAYGVNYTGKTEAELKNLMGSLDYDNGYLFESDSEYLLNGAGYSQWSQPMKPLGDPQYRVARYLLPREAMDDETKPLILNVLAGDQTFTFDLRSFDAALDPHQSEDPFVLELCDQYDIAWLIRNAGYYFELIRDEATFAILYAGNTNSQGSMKFSEDYFARLEAPYLEWTAQVNQEALSRLMPETAVAVAEIPEKMDALKQALITMGQTNRETDAEAARNAALALHESITALFDSEEMLQFGRFA